MRADYEQDVKPDGLPAAETITEFLYCCLDFIPHDV